MKRTIASVLLSALAVLPAAALAKSEPMLTYHVEPGRLDAAALQKAVKAGNDTATLRTASGGMRWAMMNGDRNIVPKDEKGAVASISTYDVYQSNGVIHVIDRVVLPN